MAAAVGLARRGSDDRDTHDRLRELIEPAVQAAADTGEAQAVDVTALFAGDEPGIGPLALVQRAIDASVRGTALTGYVCTYPGPHGGTNLAAVIRGVG